MQLKHPEILYALFFLIIPIIVHLFQLQRFKKTPFTNVQFLKKLAQQSRKSARIKKWLILATRLIALSCLIVSFSQPFVANFSKGTKHHTVIYLDNSYSMQAKGNEGELLQRAIQDLLKSLPKNEIVSFITNENSYKNLSYEVLKKTLLNVNYSPKTLDFKILLLKINQLTKDKPSVHINVLLISDFQTHKDFNLDFFDKSSRIQYTCIQTLPKTRSNTSIDSVFIAEKTLSTIILGVIVHSQELGNETAVSLFNNTRLMGKTSVKFDKKHQQEIRFPITFNHNFKGEVHLNDPALSFDNTFYFNLQKPAKINILSIGENGNYLSRIYTNDEFNFKQSSVQELAYNLISEQHSIILHEIKTIPSPLIPPLIDFVKKGGSLTIIPAMNSNINSYNKLFQQVDLGSLEAPKKKELKITDINYEHPLLKNVFKKRVSNFQYPTVYTVYNHRGKKGIQIVGLANNTSFVSSYKWKQGTIYLYASPLNEQATNLQQSSLIVPLFYNIGRQSYNIPKLYYTLGNKNNTPIDFAISLNSNEILSLSNKKEDFIPLQQRYAKKVSLKLTDKPVKSGNFKLESPLHHYGELAFNYSKTESDLSYTLLENIQNLPENIHLGNNISAVNQHLIENQKINWLFKWFLGLSVVFLFFEMLILKYFKL
ncbi:MAG: BatA domain-containing protein [Flavobacteriaceae bacterium]|nr:BatA domain-containing protein [Flavobacteriaceae bacterium]